MGKAGTVWSAGINQHWVNERRRGWLRGSLKKVALLQYEPFPYGRVAVIHRL